MAHVHPADMMLQWEATLSASKFFQKVESYVKASEGFSCMKFSDSRGEFMPHYLVMSPHSDDRMFERSICSSPTVLMATIVTLIKDTDILEMVKDSCLMSWDEDSNKPMREGQYNAVALIREGLNFVPIIQVGEQHLYIRTVVTKSDKTFIKNGTLSIHFDASGKCLDF